MNKPFVGPSGELLHDVLQQLGIVNPWITNAALCYGGTAKEITLAAKSCHPRLTRELRTVGATTVVALGNTACGSLLGNWTGISKARGRFVESNEWRVLPTYHPAAILRNPNLWPDFAIDMEKLIKPERTAQPDVTHVVTQDYRYVLNQAAAADFAVIDLETTGLDFLRDRILCIVIGLPEETYIFPAEIVNDIGFGPALQRCKAKWVGHNIQFDRKFLLHRLGVDLKITFDTMLGHYLLDERRGVHGLKEICGSLFDAPDWASLLNLGKSHDYAAVPKETLYKYAAQDGVYTRLLAYWERDELKQYPKLVRLSKKLLTPLSNVLAEVEMRGVQIDRPALAEATKQLLHERDEQEQLCVTLAGHTFNPRSPQQVGRVLFDELGLPDLLDRSTAKEVLAQLKNDHPFVPALLEYRQIEKLLGTYALPIAAMLDQAGRLHTQYHITGTVTGRLSSSSPNLQNIPVKSTRAHLIKNAFIASRGMALVNIDMCLHPDTLVKTTRGDRPISDLRPGDKVFTLRNRRVSWGEVTASCPTGPRLSYRVTFDHGQGVIASAEHRWPVRTYKGVIEKETQNLLPGDRVFPVREQLVQGRRHLYSVSCFEYSKEHFLVAEAEMGPRPAGCDVHHINEDPADNNPKNLEYKPTGTHQSEHSVKNYAKQDHTLRVERLRAAFRGKGLHVGEKNPRFGRRKGTDIICPVCNKIFYRPPCYQAVFCSRACYARARRDGLNHKVLSVELIGSSPTWAITIEPDHNYVLSCGVVTSNSQVEMRCAAVFSQDPFLLDIFNSGGDIHGETAAELFGPDYTKEQRKFVKSVNFGILFGEGAKGLAANASLEVPNMGEREARMFIDRYYRKMAGLVGWINETKRDLHEQGYVESPTGRRRRFPLLFDDNRAQAEREAVNFMCQSAASDIMLYTLVRIDTPLKTMGAHILLTVHDSVLVECPPDKVDDVINLVVKVMAFTGKELYGDSVPFTADAEVGTRWGDLTEKEV
jgi:uracil-DNA glycosylase family 4